MFAKVSLIDLQIDLIVVAGLACLLVFLFNRCFNLCMIIYICPFLLSPCHHLNWYIYKCKNQLNYTCYLKQCQYSCLLAQHTASHDEYVGHPGNDGVDDIPLAAVYVGRVVHGDGLPHAQVADREPACGHEHHAHAALPHCTCYQDGFTVVQNKKQAEEQQGHTADHAYNFSFANFTAHLRHEQTAEKRADVDCDEVYNLSCKWAHVQQLLKEDGLLLDA